MRQFPMLGSGGICGGSRAGPQGPKIEAVMTDDPADGRNQQDAMRRNRLAKALRDNLKRRKSQSRGRAEPGDVPAIDPTPADRSRYAAEDTDS